MKWILVILIAIVVLVAVVVVLGALVPRDHVAGASITLRQPPETVWQAIRDLGAVPQWWPETKTSVRTADKDGLERWEQNVGGLTMAMLVETDERPRRLVTRIDALPGAAFGGSWTYEIAPAPDGSRVTVTERGWIANPLFRFLSRFVFGYYATQEQYLKALGRKFGETVAPVRAPASGA